MRASLRHYSCRAMAGARLTACSELLPINLCFIGGGGFTLPSFFSSLYEESVIDAVELDPKVIAAATEHMGIKEPEFSIRKVLTALCTQTAKKNC